MRGVLEMTLPNLPVEAPKHLLGIGDIDDLLDGAGRGIDLFDCAAPTRLARHGVALVPLAGERFRISLRSSRWAADQGPLVEGCPCEACTVHSRAYLHYLIRAHELTGVRLMTLHNLTYVEALMRGARRAIEEGWFDRYREACLGDISPWDALTGVKTPANG
jgi:tRNA-guanine family transglycosylase